MPSQKKTQDAKKESSAEKGTKTWAPKDERQYEHIKESYEEKGQGGRAKEIAARTVNKQRSSEGRTKEQNEGEPIKKAPKRSKSRRGKTAKKTQKRTQAKQERSTAKEKEKNEDEMEIEEDKGKSNESNNKGRKKSLNRKRGKSEDKETEEGSQPTKKKK